MKYWRGKAPGFIDRKESKNSVLVLTLAEIFGNILNLAL